MGAPDCLLGLGNQACKVVETNFSPHCIQAIFDPCFPVVSAFIQDAVALAWVITKGQKSDHVRQLCQLDLFPGSRQRGDL